MSTAALFVFRQKPLNKVRAERLLARFQVIFAGVRKLFADKFQRIPCAAALKVGKKVLCGSKCIGDIKAVGISIVPHALLISCHFVVKAYAVGVVDDILAIVIIRSVLGKIHAEPAANAVCLQQTCAVIWQIFHRIGGIRCPDDNISQLQVAQTIYIFKGTSTEKFGRGKLCLQLWESRPRIPP